jgi:hypothetical protein
VICGRRGIAVNAHHLNAWASFPNERYDVDNGVCLCVFDHERFHQIYGKGKNTKEQFEEYKAITCTLINIANQDAVVASTTKRMIQVAERDTVVKKILKDAKTDLDGYVKK